MGITKNSLLTQTKWFCLILRKKKIKIKKKKKKKKKGHSGYKESAIEQKDIGETDFDGRGTGI